MCASFDKYIEALPKILHDHTVDITRWVHDGERHLLIEFVGAQLEEPKFLEADGTSHTIDHIDCLQRNISFSMPLYTDVHVTLNDKKNVFSSIFLGMVPL